MWKRTVLTLIVNTFIGIYRRYLCKDLCKIHFSLYSYIFRFTTRLCTAAFFNTVYLITSSLPRLISESYSGVSTCWLLLEGSSWSVMFWLEVTMLFHLLIGEWWLINTFFWTFLLHLWYKLLFSVISLPVLVDFSLLLHFVYDLVFEG